MAESTENGSQMHPFELKLKVVGEEITARGRLPRIPIRIADFLPVMQSLASEVADLSERREAREGRSISCAAGCGACCRQPVPISLSEAIRLRELVANLPTERQQQVRERFAAALATLRDHGLLDEFETMTADSSAADLEEIGLRYFRLQIACPFLEDESCSIHPDRPLACREYLVTSPAENCTNPSAESIRMVKQPVRLSSLLSRVEREREGAPARSLLLVQSLETSDPANMEEPQRFPPEALFSDLASQLLGKPSAPSAEDDPTNAPRSGA